MQCASSVCVVVGCRFVGDFCLFTLLYFITLIFYLIIGILFGFFGPCDTSRY